MTLSEAALMLGLLVCDEDSALPDIELLERESHTLLQERIRDAEGKVVGRVSLQQLRLIDSDAEDERPVFVQEKADVVYEVSDPLGCREVGVSDGRLQGDPGVCSTLGSTQEPAFDLGVCPGALERLFPEMPLLSLEECVGHRLPGRVSNAYS